MPTLLNKVALPLVTRRSVLRTSLSTRLMSSLSYTPERAEELKDNIDGVLAEVNKAGSDKVSPSPLLSPARLLTDKLLR